MLLRGAWGFFMCDGNAGGAFSPSMPGQAARAGPLACRGIRCVRPAPLRPLSESHSGLELVVTGSEGGLFGVGRCYVIPSALAMSAGDGPSRCLSLPWSPSMNAVLRRLTHFAFTTLTATMFVGAIAPSAQAAAGIPVVAAENFYGDMVKQIGGNRVAVKSIMSNPDQDPHLFETSTSTARQLSAARVVVHNGA